VLKSDLDNHFRLVVVADLAPSGGRVGKTIKWAAMKALTAITVAPQETTLRWAVSERIQFTATGRYSDDTTADLTSTAAWNSSAPACRCTIGDCGLVPRMAWALSAGLFTVVDCTGNWAFPSCPPPRPGTCHFGRRHGRGHDHLHPMSTDRPVRGNVSTSGGPGDPSGCGLGIELTPGDVGHA